MNNQNLMGVYYNPQAAKFVLFIQPSCKLSRNEKHFINAITFDGLELVNSLPDGFIQLCYLVLYQKSMVASPGYDNMRIRHAYDGDSTVCFRSYDYFNQDCFSDYNTHVYPIIHVFQVGDLSCVEARFFRITDSSIWNHITCWPYSSSMTEEEKNTVNLRAQSELINVLKRIVANRDYYGLAIAQEYVDLNARLTKQAYISFGYGTLREKMLAKTTGNNHGDRISPFLFHSEGEMERERKKDEDSHKNDVLDLHRYRWRALLLDDKIKDEWLTPEELHISKERILQDRIDDMFGKKGSCLCVYLDDIILNDYKKGATNRINELFHSVRISETGDESLPIIVVLCVDTIEKAEIALKNYKFDFILLDYLLKEENRIQRYGYELLEDIAREIGKDGERLPETNRTDGKSMIVGPDQRFFFMFISAFTTAISERLRLSGWSRSEEIWHIAEGACPTNTPQLFNYNLRKMMIKRIKDSGMENLSARRIYDLVWKVYLPLEKDPQRLSVRKRANANYQRILSLLYHYNRILRDVEIPNEKDGSIFLTRGSVLMTSFASKHNHLGGLLEHLVQLIHLTAFGSVRQWPEMWEEYLFFKAQYQDLYSDANETDTFFDVTVSLFDASGVERHVQLYKPIIDDCKTIIKESGEICVLVDIEKCKNEPKFTIASSNIPGSLQNAITEAYSGIASQDIMPLIIAGKCQLKYHFKHWEFDQLCDCIETHILGLKSL